jgi:branched-chain amino acid transport system permease protein
MAPFGIELLDPATFVVQTINGLQRGFILFLIASGLTVILGILDVLNLAHGELYVAGAFLAVSVFGFLTGTIMEPPGTFDPVSIALFIGVILLGLALTAAILFPIGAITEAVLIRPIYNRDESYQLVMTFAVLLIIRALTEASLPTGSLFPVKGAIDQIPSFELLPFAEALGLQNQPTTVLFIILVGAVVAAGLFYFFNRTKTGRIIRATAINREMAQALGVSPDRTFTLVFALGAFLAGFAGGMVALSSPPQIAFGETGLVQSFVVIVVGGLGSLRGAFVGALLVGILSNWMVVVNPALQTAAPFLVMLGVLLVKPEGLFGTWGERT